MNDSWTEINETHRCFWFSEKKKLKVLKSLESSRLYLFTVKITFIWSGLRLIHIAKLTFWLLLKSKCGAHIVGIAALVLGIWLCWVSFNDAELVKLILGACSDCNYTCNNSQPGIMKLSLLLSTESTDSVLLKIKLQRWKWRFYWFWIWYSPFPSTLKVRV